MTTEAEIRSYEAIAAELAAFAIRQMREHRPSASERSTKAHAADWVTVVDVDIERHVRSQLADGFPDHVVVGEELGGSDEGLDGRLVWYVDPIDGTTNFVHGLPGPTFSLALADAEGLLVAVLADPHGQEVFTARRGGGARLNGNLIACTDTATLVGGIVTTELAGLQPWPGLLEMMTGLAERQCVTRIMGSSALTLASVGAGRSYAGILGGANPIDVAAGVLIAREAGATVVGGPDINLVLGAGPAVGLSGLLVVAPGVAAAMRELVASLPA